VHDGVKKTIFMIASVNMHKRTMVMYECITTNNLKNRIVTITKLGNENVCKKHRIPHNIWVSKTPRRTIAIYKSETNKRPRIVGSSIYHRIRIKQ